MVKFHYRGPYESSSEEFLLDRLLHPPTTLIAVDTETVSLKDRTMLGFGVAINPNEAYYIPLWPERSELLEQVYDGLICNPNITKLGHNYGFDLSVFRRFALSENRPVPDFNNIHDTGIMANVSALDAELYKLGIRFTDFKLFTISDLLDEARRETGKRNVNMLDVNPELTALKCMNDVRTTYTVYEEIPKLMNVAMLDCYQVDRQLFTVLKTIEPKGLKLNQKRVKTYYRKLSDSVEVYQEWADDHGFSISSPAQIGSFLAGEGIVLPPTKSNRQFDTSEEELKKYAGNKYVDPILEYRKMSKILSTYIEPFIGQERAYTHFRLDLATGRLASASEECVDHVCRNQQNIPAVNRDIYEPDNGEFLWADMSQLEMRVFAYLTKDETLLKAYSEGQSIHNITFKALYPNLSRKITNERGEEVDSPFYVKAKTANFAMIFDAAERTIAEQCEIQLKEARRFKKTWFELYPQAREYMLQQQSTNSTYEETIFGRRMVIPTERGIHHANKCRINYPVQGSGADLNKRAILSLYKQGFLTDLRLQVHDEILNDGLFEFPHELVSNIHPDIYVPWEVKTGPVWT